MWGINKESGQITVFLSIILLAVMLLAGVLVDASRISSGEALAKKAVGSAARSILAGYGSRLKENYGLFAFNYGSEQELLDSTRQYIEKNLMIREEGDGIPANVDMYGFRIEKLSVVPIYNLSENKVFRQQVLEYMKYRAPKEIVEGFVERLSAVKDMGRMSTAYKKKVGIDKIAGKMNKAQQSLKKSVDGSGGEKEAFINGFNLNGIWEETLKSYIGLYSRLRSLESELESVEKELSRLQNSDNPENEGRIHALKVKRSSLKSDISECKHEIGKSWTDLRYSLTGDYIGPNEKAVGQIEIIVETGKKAEALINGLEEYLDSDFMAGSGFMSDFTETLKKDIKVIKELVISGQKALALINDLKNNAQILSGIIDQLDLLKNRLENSETDAGNIISLEESLLEAEKDYNNVEYSYEKPEKSGNYEDPRKNKVQEVKDALLVKLFNDRNFIDEGILAEELPSRKKIASRNFDLEDKPYTGDMPSDGAGGAGSGASIQYRGELDKVAENIDLYDEENTFQEDALELSEGIGSILEGDMAKLRDNIYINEYIMGMFKNLVPSVQGEETGKAAFINGVPRDSKNTFYECEVEYILHGNASEITNKVMTSAQILLVRFGANTLHVYTDIKKKELSVAAATAIAGWWTGGAGIPVLSNLIMFAWGMGEAVIDVKDLSKGKQVPIYKSPGDWKLDIGLPKAAGPKTDARLSFSYHDYLRLFLLTMNEDEKLGRMEDLIEINTGLQKPGFKVSGSNTFIRVEAEISMKNLFASGIFIPESVKTKDGRRIIRVLVYEGY